MLVRLSKVLSPFHVIMTTFLFSCKYHKCNNILEHLHKKYDTTILLVKYYTQYFFRQNVFIKFSLMQMVSVHWLQLLSPFFPLWSPWGLVFSLWLFVIEDLFWPCLSPILKPLEALEQWVTRDFSIVPRPLRDYCLGLDKFKRAPLTWKTTN